MAVDPRGAVAARVAFGAVLATDLADRARLAPWLGTADGAVPPDLWHALDGDAPWAWSLHLGLPHAATVQAALVAQVGLAVAVAAGWHPRAAALGSWLLLRSLDARNPLVHYGGDSLAAAILLWVAATPWSGGGNLERALAGWLLRLQVVVLFLGAGAAKLSEPSWQDGTALQRALAADTLVRPVGAWLADHPVVLPWLGQAALAIELAAPLTLLLPWRAGLATAGIASLVGLLLGIHVSFDVGWFPAIAAVATLALLPPGVWDRARPRPPEPSTRPEGLRTAAVAGLLGITLTTGLDGLDGRTDLPWPSPVWTALRAGDLVQRWGVFADPDPSPRWFVAKAALTDGTWVDLVAEGAPVRWERPTGPPALFEDSFRWRLLLVKATARRSEGPTGHAAARVLAARWSAHHPDRPAREVTLYRLVGAADSREVTRWDVVGAWP